MGDYPARAHLYCMRCSHVRGRPLHTGGGGISKEKVCPADLQTKV